jgi:hypothetical protein
MKQNDFDTHKSDDTKDAPITRAVEQDNVNQPMQFPLVMLPGGFAVDAKFMEVIRLTALDHIPQLTRNTSYEASDIVGKQFWQLLTTYETHLAGRCMTCLTQRDQLPLVDLGRGTDNHKRYMLK